MWNKPLAMVVVRPSRYTFEFINQYPDFTLTAFPKEFHKDLSYLGKVSGRDENKISKTALHPCKSEKVDSPGFAEAELIIECRKTYWNDFHPEHFLDPGIRKRHEISNIHRMYFGEIVSIQATEKYLKQV
jgi:flavin reductase (DIM6/NTAB) family NADH-FMN oxidoreductase RutF